MKLHYHPVSTTCRPILMFATDSGLELELKLVDLMAGEHLKEPYTSVNPNRLVPVLEDGDFRLTESSAILKYLADKIGSPAYPRDLKKRARVNEMMDWLNTGFYRDFGYGLVYPQIFPNHRRPTQEGQSDAVNRGKEKSRAWFKTLDQVLIGPTRSYLCGDAISLADYFGAPMITLGEAIGCDFSGYPNIVRWLDRMKAQPSWAPANEAFNGMVAAFRGQTFVAI